MEENSKVKWIAAAAIVGVGTAVWWWSRSQKRNPAQLVEDLVDLCDNVSHNLESRILSIRDSLAS